MNDSVTGLAYSLSVSNATITGLGTYSATGQLVIPSTVDGHPVVAIGSNAFQGRSGLTSLTIPTSVTSIGDSAFYGCFNVVSAYFLGNSIPDNGTAFKASAGTTIYVKAASNWTATTWGGCTVIKVKITTPPISTVYSENQNTSLTDGVTTVPGTFSWESATITGAGVYTAIFTPNDITLGTLGYSDFADIDVNVLMIDVPPDYTASISVTGNVTILSAPITTDGTLIIPSTIGNNPVTSISPGAFQNNTTLTSVSFPPSITYIGASAFLGCSNLTSVTVPKDTSIGPGAFENTSVIFASIGNSGTRSYKSRYAAMRETTVINDVTVGEYAFKNIASLTAVRIGENVKSIGTGAFNMCSNLTSVYFLGDAILEDHQFDTSTTTIIYVKKDSTGWGDMFSGCSVIKVKVLTLPTSTPIVIGSQLSTSELNPGTATVLGTFSWNEPTQIFWGAGNYYVKFTPNDPELLDYSVIFAVAVAVAPLVKHNYTVYFRK